MGLRFVHGVFLNEFFRWDFPRRDVSALTIFGDIHCRRLEVCFLLALNALGDDHILHPLLVGTLSIVDTDLFRWLSLRNTLEDRVLAVVDL